MKKAIATIVLLMTSISAYADSGFSLDLGIGFHDINKGNAFIEYAGEKRPIKFKYQSFDQASNPLGILQLKYKPKDIPVYIAILHISSLLDKDSNYGFNMLYLGTTIK